MALELTLPPPLAGFEDEIRREAERADATPSEYAKLLIYLASALRKPRAEKPCEKWVRSFLTAKGVDADKVAAAMNEVITLFIDGHKDPVSVDEGFDPVAHEIDDLGLPVQRARRVGRASSFGKYAHLNLSSDAYAREKREGEAG